jgi:glucose-1-phosphate cytidylyltransferase
MKPKVVILAGGLGTRLAEQTEVRPKPMVEVGGRPLLWHLMKQYASFGFDEFVVALGYKGDFIKRWFLDYHTLAGSKTVRLRDGSVTTHAGEDHDDWTVHLMDTGAATMTGGRVKRLSGLLADGTFMLTYGDGVANVDLVRLLAFHRAHG